MASLADASLRELHTAAVQEAKGGDGDLLLSYVIWPTDDRVAASARALKPDVIAWDEVMRWSSPRARFERVIAERSPNVGLDRAIRDYHVYREPLAGMCAATINLGPRWSGKVRCSRRAKRGRYCLRHAQRR